MTVEEGSEVKIKDEVKLKTYIEASFDYEHYPLCASESGFSLQEYYSKIHDVYLREEGIYIEGEQLYQ